MEPVFQSTMCNSSGLTASNVTILAGVRGASGILCVVICAVLLMSIFFRSDRSKAINRLLTYITAAALMALLVDIAQVISVGCDFTWHRTTCEIVGFFNQVTIWILLLQVTLLVGLIGLQYWCPSLRNVLSPAKEIVAWFVIVFASVTVALIAVGTRGYGMNGAWCWIRASRVVEQWVLWYGWLFPAIVVIAILLAITTRHSEKEMEMYYHASEGEDCSVKKNCQGEARKIKKLNLCIVGYAILAALSVSLSFVPSVNLTTPFLTITGAIIPTGKLAVPIILAAHLYNAATTKKENHTHDDYKEIPASDEGRECLVNTMDEEDYPRKVRKFGRSEKDVRSVGSSEKGYPGDITGSLLTTDTDRSELSGTI